LYSKSIWIKSGLTASTQQLKLNRSSANPQTAKEIDLWIQLDAVLHLVGALMAVTGLMATHHIIVLSDVLDGHAIKLQYPAWLP
jgi:hypothetical protein